MARFSCRTLAWSFVVLVISAFPLSAQPEGYTEIPQKRSISSDRLGCYIGNVSIDEEQLRELQKIPNCKDVLKDTAIDFRRETLVHYSIGSDCHMRFAIKVLKSDTDKRYKVIIDNIYGGCRAGGWREGWIVIEKLPPGYNLEIVEVMVDRITSNGPAADFVYPQPPSAVERERIEAREIDVKGCLPLTGQSQWVLTGEGYLSDAIARAADKRMCIEYFKKLNIDFEKQTLVGYSFSSGYCARPPGLEIKTTKETSSDITENRFLFEIRYDKAGSDYCKVWTTYPLWLLVSKLPEHYGVAFEAKPK